jgi:hypothetical protein
MCFFLNNVPWSYNFNSIKFTKRYDLSVDMRLKIACSALSGSWGTVTSLANQYDISRTFVYQLKNNLMDASSQIFGDTSLHSTETSVKDILSFMLSLRLEGKCAIIPISEIMQRFNLYKYYSVGSVSTILNYFGSYLPSTIEATQKNKYVIIASDEIFSHSLPILLTIDPVSSCILKIELANSRDIEKWKNHWNCIQNNGYYAVYLVNDEGISMAGAQKETFPDIIRQADTFHGVAHRLGLWVNRLETKAYNAIEQEYDRYERLDSVKSDKTLDKIIAQYNQARKESWSAINLYDNFHYLYLELIKNLQVFDADGNVNSRIDAEKNTQIIIELLETLQINALKKELKCIKNLLSDLFPFLDQAHTVVSELENLPIENYILKFFYIAWQYQKNWIKAKQKNRRKYYKDKETKMLKLAEDIIGNKFSELKNEIYSKLDTIIQSSAIVENINSIIRIYLNTSKNHITQEFLNLIMFYLNHRKYYDGKRKNKTPMELFKGQPQEKDWMEILFEKVPWENCNFFN